MNPKILVLDCGTSALKATLFSPDGMILAQAESGFPEAAPHRQSPAGWWFAACTAVSALDCSGTIAISLTGTMENLVPLDAALEPVGDAILYTDPCGAPYLEGLGDNVIDANILCGNTAEPLMSAFKLAWLRHTQPEDFARTRRVLLGPKDYLVHRLTGVLATDASNAATSGLMDLVSRKWSPELLAVHGVGGELLPDILPATSVAGTLTEAAAHMLGLVPGIPIINGCGDGAATTLGSGAARADDVSLYLGTSGWVARVASPVDRQPRPYYRLPHPLLADGVIEIAPILSAGAAAQWARDTLGLDIATAEAQALAADADPGEALFLPYLNGERSPFVDLDLRGSFVGLSPGHDSGALYYAVLEGVALAIRANLSAMAGSVGAVSLVGGGARSALWPKILADVLGQPISVPADPVAAASLGAFRLAAHALNLPPMAPAASTLFQPRPERQDRVQKRIRQFDAATSALRDYAGIK